MVTGTLAPYFSTHGPELWFLNRSSGVIVLILLTLSLALGILGAGRQTGGFVPVFVPHALHRNLSVIALVLTAAHAMTAVIDTYVDIRWWQMFSPIGGSYRPLWLGLGALAFDLMLIVALTSWARHRLGPLAWRRIHLVGYAVWPIAFAHGAGIGTDAETPWARWVAAACLALLVLALVVRLGRGSDRGGAVPSVTGGRR
jgi:sulfoxide reductase heme-binding subunit YedZ